jgi:hypothetical protein
MGEPVEQGSGHLGIAEHAGPFAEAQIGGDGDTGAFVELAQQVEQQGTARRAERQVSQLVKDDEVEAQQALGKLTSLVQHLFLFQCVDQIDGGDESDLLAMMLDRLNAKRCGDVIAYRLPSPKTRN